VRGHKSPIMNVVVLSWLAGTAGMFAGRPSELPTWAERTEDGVMTYCLALRLHEGMLFLADTRTNAGVDNVGTYRKMHVLQPADDRLFVIESAGSLATTQEVLDRMGRDLAAGEATESLATVGHLFEAALYLGRLSREVAAEHKEGLGQVGADGTATFILGGHVGDEPPDILLVYPEGNYIRASDERPFLQIGESKYGKFMLELAVETHVDLVTAAKIALGSMMSTARANISVGPPYDIGFYLNGSRTLSQFRIESDSPLLERLRKVWERHLLDGIAELPAITHDDLTEIDDPIEIEIIESTE
jgi:putative proteasome-type protease